MNLAIRREIFAAVCLGSLSIGGFEAIAGSSIESQDQVRSVVQRSLVHLYFWGEGDAEGSRLAGHATGFVIVGPGYRKCITTAAHPFWATDPKNRIIQVTFRYMSMGRAYAISSIILDSAHDISMLTPEQPELLDKVPHLDLSRVEPKHGDPLLIVGSPSGLTFRDYIGEAKSSPITVQQMSRQQEKTLKAFAPMGSDLTFVQHSIPIAEGFSGSPVVSLRDGKVVGLQSATLKDAAFVGFAVHWKHFLEFDWNAPSYSFMDAPLVSRSSALAWKLAPVYPFEANRNVTQLPSGLGGPPSVKVDLAGIEVEAPFVSHGVIEPNALSVIDKYIDDKDFFLKEPFSGAHIKQLQVLLDRIPMERISNPILGFQILKPKGYKYTVKPTKDPNGLLITFAPNRDVPAPYDQPLEVWVTIEPGLYIEAQARFDERVALPPDAQLHISLNSEQKKSPTAFAEFREGIVNTLVAESVEHRAAQRQLKMQNGSTPNKFHAQAFRHLISENGRWLRSSYIADDEKEACHLIRIRGREPRVFVIHHPYAERNAIAFNTGTGTLDDVHAEYVLMGASLSVR